MMPAIVSAETPAPDRVLVSQAQDGEREALEELAKKFRRPAYLLALQLTGRPEMEKDVAQDAMLRLFQHIDRVDIERPVRPWLYQIVRNRVRDLRRRARLRRYESLEALREAGRPETVETRPDPADDLARRELQARVWSALEELSVPHKEILVLRDYQDLSYREISKVLDIPQGTVMSRLHAARRSMRKVLKAGDGMAEGMRQEE